MYLTLFLASLLAVLHLAALVVAAAPSAQALAIATTLAGVAAVLSPLVLRYVSWDGNQKAAASWLLALLIAVGADLMAGDLTLSWTSLVTVLLGSGVVWTVQQAVFRILSSAAPQLVYRAKRVTTQYRHT